MIEVTRKSVSNTNTPTRRKKKNKKVMERPNMDIWELQ